jgi:hypothetical protein
MGDKITFTCPIKPYILVASQKLKASGKNIRKENNVDDGEFKI